ncbi:hypothetical protein ACFLTA_02375 [Bacteroidota bacterium]
MKTRNLLTVFAFVLVALITMVACEKNKSIVTLDLITATDDAIADMAYDDVFSEVDAVMNTMDLLGYVMPGDKSGLEIFETCKVITVEQPDGAFWPRTVTIDYGEGCTIGKRTRKGKIVITVSGPMWQEGSQRIVSLEDFYVNDHKIEGVRTVTNQGRHLDGNYEGKRYISVSLDSGKVITPEGQVITKEINRTRTFVEGEDSKWDTRDDIWYIEGIATGVNRNGIAFTREITSPLWKEIGCRFITQGTVLISADGRPDAILDYGEGDCDPIATVTVGEETREINLKRW